MRNMIQTDINTLRSLDTALDKLILAVKQFGAKPTKKNREAAKKAEEEFKASVGIHGW